MATNELHQRKLHMTHTARDAYLEAQVLTATPQRLRLMLIDGALRFARQALDLWGDGEQRQSAYLSLVRCRDIVTELYAAIKADQLAVAQDVKAIYLFIFRRLAEAPTYDDPERIREVIGVLEEERETWRQLCEKMPEAPEPRVLGSFCSEEITARGLPAIQPDTPCASAAETASSTRLSLEA